MAAEAHKAALADDAGLLAEAIDQRAKGARRDFVGQPRAQRFHLETGGERLVAMMSRERIASVTRFRFVPFARRW